MKLNIEHRGHSKLSEELLELPKIFRNLDMGSVGQERRVEGYGKLASLMPQTPCLGTGNNRALPS